MSEEGEVVTTATLLEALAPEQYDFEVHFYAGGCFRCTHRIYIENGVIHDTGIDDEEGEYTHEEFLALYPADMEWTIDEIFER